MLKKLLVSTLLSVACVSAFAGTDELDQDKANQAIQGTVVLRVDTRTGEMAMTRVDEVVSTEAAAQELVNENFEAVPQDKVRSELDREAGASSWYWYYPGYAYGYGYGYGYYSYGACYNPWYSYGYGYYNYYYYNRYSWWW